MMAFPLFLIFILQVRKLLSVCIPASTTGICNSCAFSHYSQIIIDNPGGTANELDCKLKLSAVNSIYYIQSGSCATGSACDGTVASPSDSILKTIQKAHLETSKSDNSKIIIYLLNGDHYILKSDLPSSIIINQFFRRVLVEVSIQPLYCSINNIAGCISDNSIKPTINIKTHQFSIFVTNKLSITNIIFNSIDEVLDLKNDACVNAKAICCTETNLIDKTHKCFILGSNSTISSIKGSLVPSLFVLEGLFDSTVTINPTLELVNTDFLFFTCIQPQNGFNSLISLAMNDPIITMTMVTFSKSIFPNGLINGYNWQNDLFYEYLTSSQISDFQTKYLNSKFIYTLNNVTISNYNLFKINITTSSLITSKNSSSVGTLENVVLVNMTNIDPLSFHIFDISKGSISIKSSNFSSLTEIMFISCQDSIFNFSNFRISGLVNSQDHLINQISLCHTNFLNSVIDSITTKTYMLLIQANSSIISLGSTFSNLKSATILKLLKIDFNITSSNFTFIDYNIYSESSQSTLFYTSSNIFNGASGNMFSLNQKDKIIFRDFTIENVTGTEIFIGTLADSNIYYNCLFKNISSANFQAFNFIPVSSFHSNNTFINVKAGNILSISDTLVQGKNYWWNATDLLFENCTLTEYYAFCIWKRNFILNNTMMKNVNHSSLESFLNTFGSDDSLFQIRNFSIINPHLNNTSGSQYYFQALFYASNTLITVENLTIEIDSNLLFDSNGVGFKDAASVTINNVSIVRKVFNQKFFIHGLLISNVPILQLTNLKLQRLGCSKTTTGFDNTLGIFTIIGFPSFDIKSNNMSVSIKNVEIDQISCPQSSGIGIVNINSVLIDNVSCSNTNAGNFGAHFFFNAIQNLSISNIKGQNGTSLKGGAIYMNLVINSTIINANFIGSNSQDGGMIWISDSKSLIRSSNFSISNSDYGGLVYENNLVDITFQSIRLSNFTTKFNGGGFIVLNSFLYVFDLIATNISATEGGLFYVYTGLNFSISSVFCNNCVSSIKGNFLFLMESNIMSMNWITITNSISPSQGNIFIYSQETNLFSISNIVCSNISIYDGSCLYIFTNSIVALSNLKVSNCSGGAIFIYSQYYLLMNISNVLVEGHNLNIPQSLISKMTNYILKNEKTNLILWDFNISSSFFEYGIQCTQGSISSVYSKFENNNLLNKTSYAYFFSDLNVTLYYVKYLGNLLQESNLFYATNSKIYIQELLCINSISNESSPISIETSNITINRSIFQNSTGYKGISEFLHSNCLFIDIKFENEVLRNDFQLNFISLVKEFSILNFQAIFRNVTFISKNPFRMLSISGFNDIQIENCQFQSINIYSNKSSSKFQNPSGCKFIDTKNIKITNSTFYNLSDTSGAAIYIENTLKQINNITISQSSFENCNSSLGGCLYIKGSSDLQVSGSNITNGMAITINQTGQILGGIGGGIYFDCYYIDTSCSFVLQNNQMILNKAEFYGSNLFSKSEVTLQNNRIEPGNLDLISYPLKTLFLYNINTKFKASNTQLINTELQSFLLNNEIFTITQSSGNAFSFSFVLTDNKNNIMIRDNTSSGYIEATLDRKLSKSTLKLEKGAAICEKGIFFFENIKITTDPNSNVTLNIGFLISIFDAISNTSSSLKINSVIKVYIRNCIRGEILADDRSCLRCQPGYYSIIDPMSNAQYQECKLCPENAICQGGDLIFPINGYWRSSQESVIMQKCLNLDACSTETITNVTSMQEFIQSGCSANYKGNFCFECISGYARVSSSGPCVQCNANLFNYFKFIIVLLGISTFIMIQVKYYMMLNENDSPILGVLFKIFVNHFQQLSLITLIDLGWSSQIKSLFSFLGYFSFLSDDLFSVDCFFTDIGYNALFFKIIFSNLLPIIISGTIFCIMVIFRSLKGFGKHKEEKIEKMKRELKVTFAVSVYILFPEILKNCFELVNCQRLDETSGLKVLKKSPSLVCFELTHILWTVFVALPGILMWGVFAIFFFYLLIKKYKKSLIKILDRNYHQDLLNVQKSSIRFDESSFPTIRSKSLRMSECPENKHNVKLNILPNENDNEEVKDNKENTDLKESTDTKNDKYVDKSNKNLSELEKDKSPPKKKKEKLIRYIMFLYRGYKGKYYYWEILIFSKKFIFILLTSFNEIIDNHTKGVLLMVIFVIFLTMTRNAMPYGNNVLNKLELISYYCLFLTANIGNILFSQDAQNIAVFFLVFIGFMHSYFFLLWLYYFLFFLKNSLKLKSLMKKLRGTGKSKTMSINKVASKKISFKLVNSIFRKKKVEEPDIFKDNSIIKSN